VLTFEDSISLMMLFIFVLGFWSVNGRVVFGIIACMDGFLINVLLMVADSVSSMMFFIFVLGFWSVNGGVVYGIIACMDGWYDFVFVCVLMGIYGS
jgi:hypothetical protein